MLQPCSQLPDLLHVLFDFHVMSKVKSEMYQFVGRLILYKLATKPQTVEAILCLYRRRLTAGMQLAI